MFLLDLTATSPPPAVVLEVHMLRQVALLKLIGDGTGVRRTFPVRCVGGQVPIFGVVVVQAYT